MTTLESPDTRPSTASGQISPRPSSNKCNKSDKVRTSQISVGGDMKSALQSEITRRSPVGALNSGPQSEILRRASLSPSSPSTSPNITRPLTIVCENLESNNSSNSGSRLTNDTEGDRGAKDVGSGGGEGTRGRGSRTSPHRLSSESSNGGGSGSDEPTSTSKQLNKLKRFLATLQSLGSDISADIGDRVHSLVIALVNNDISIEEFHDQLHKTTNFPLRPFVVPFLKSSLPILQQELREQAQRVRMSPTRFLAKNEYILFDVLPSPSSDSPPGSRDLRNCKNDNGKRAYPTDVTTNGNHQCGELPRPPKCSRQSPGSDSLDVATSGSRDVSYGYGIRPIRLQDISTSRIMREQMERDRLLQERDRYFNVYNLHRLDVDSERTDRRDDDWKQLESVLQCMAGMVEKCQRSLVLLQQRSIRSREEQLRRRSHDAALNSGLGSIAIDIKRDHHSAILRHTDEHRLDMIRKAEEAVKEVKRQAVSELQKAVAAAEAKASEILAVDRLKMERALEEVKQRTRDEVTSLLGRQEDSKESCWNCGRLASETCSGCNEARYCGSFCQHRHWESHHRVCGRNNPSITSSSSSSSSSSCRTTSLMTSSNSHAVDGRDDQRGILLHRVAVSHNAEHVRDISSTGTTATGGSAISEILIKQEKP